MLNLKKKIQNLYLDIRSMQYVIITLRLRLFQPFYHSLLKHMSTMAGHHTKYTSQYSNFTKLFLNDFSINSFYKLIMQLRKKL